MSDQQKQFYLYIDGQAVPVSEEVYREYRHYARKEEYFLHDLKREKFVCDQAARTATFTPSREDSYDRLLEGDRQFAAQGPTLEETVVSSLWMQDLMGKLSP